MPSGSVEKAQVALELLKSAVLELAQANPDGITNSDTAKTLGLQSNYLLIRPCEVLSRVANVTILEVANNALRVLLQHRHVIIGSLA